LAAVRCGTTLTPQEFTMAYATHPLTLSETSTLPVPIKVHPKTVDQFGAAAYVGVVSPKTMENWRSLGIGPRYLKLGGRVAYRIADLDAWLEEQVIA
jgi:hypothetical protein